MTKTDLSYKPAGGLQSAGDPSPAIDDFKNYTCDVWFCFRRNFFKKLSPGPKTSLERCGTRFFTICAKNQALKTIISFFFEKNGAFYSFKIIKSNINSP